jgi:electron transfer flavoprotein beta subunit
MRSFPRPHSTVTRTADSFPRNWLTFEAVLDVKILVPIKQVVDPENASRVHVSSDGKALVATGLERKPNPFDEYALETALRLTEDARSPRQRLGEIVAVTLGPPTTETMLRAALATGADRAIRVEITDDMLDGRLAAHLLASLAKREGVDLIVMGKQSSDGDGNEVGQRIAALLDWPQATSATAIVQETPDTLCVEREVDGGVVRIRVGLPAVVTVDLRIVGPSSVRSRQTPAEHLYSHGVRFAPLPAIMMARRKPLERCEAGSLGAVQKPRLSYASYLSQRGRSGGKVVASPTELVRLLTSEAKVI